MDFEIEIPVITSQEEYDLTGEVFMLKMKCCYNDIKNKDLDVAKRCLDRCEKQTLDNQSIVEEPMDCDQQVCSSLNNDSSNELASSLLEYVVKGTRLLHCYKRRVWKEFLEENVEMKAKHCVEDIRDFFLKHILPKASALNIPASWKKKFDILQLNESFLVVSTGYVYTPSVKYAAIDMQILENIDYRLVRNTEDLPFSQKENSPMQCDISNSDDKVDNNFQLDTQKSSPPEPHIVIASGMADPVSAIIKKSQKLSRENKALVSTLVSFDFELFRGNCQTLETIHERLREHKEYSLCQQNRPIRFDANSLRCRLKTLVKFRRDIQNITNERFQINK